MIATPRPWAGPALAGLARVVLGVLWLNEGLLKYHAGFAGKDILLVAGGAQTNTRVPPYFRLFASTVMEPASGLFGVMIPLLETALGIALVLGVFTRLAAVISVFTLLLYWSSDQLIWEYPVMAALSVAVLIWPKAASRFSVQTLIGWFRRRAPAG
ncbi:DoxX family membrane protein [Leifsonia sp. SIMBA_070]|uniref:DoxX family membrane protein n=1 Tax=Leifsonia sp. SIMBA_070 TaxID=3085810 RepID=UPI00397CF3E3